MGQQTLTRLDSPGPESESLVLSGAFRVRVREPTRRSSLNMPCRILVDLDLTPNNNTGPVSPIVNATHVCLCRAAPVRTELSITYGVLFENGGQVG